MGSRPEVSPPRKATSPFSPNPGTNSRFPPMRVPDEVSAVAEWLEKAAVERSYDTRPGIGCVPSSNDRPGSVPLVAEPPTVNPTPAPVVDAPFQNRVSWLKTSGLDGIISSQSPPPRPLAVNFHKVLFWGTSWTADAFPPHM